MPPHIKSAESESEMEKEEFKPETPVKPLSFDWVFKKKKADNTDPAESEERKEAKNIIKNIFSKPNEEAGASDSDTEKQDEPRKSSALKFPNLFGLRGSKKDKSQQEDKGEKLDKPDIKIDGPEEKVEPLQEYKDGEWVDVPSEFSKREEKSESTLKKLLGINNKNEEDNKEHADDEEKADHKRLPSLRKWLKNRSKQDEIVNDSGEAEEKDKSDVDDVKKIEDKPEDHTRLPSLKKWLKNRSKQEEPETKTEDIKTEDVKEEPEIKEEPGEIKEEQPKKSSVFRIGKYFGKTEDKAQTKEDKSDTSDSESDSDAEQEKKRTNFKKWLAQSKGKAKTEKEPKSKSSDSESDSDTEEVKKQNKFKRWLGSGRKSKPEAKVESEDSFKKEMQQTNGRELEDKILEKTDDEGDKVSEFTSGSQEELAKPETITKEPEKEDSSKSIEKKDENKRTSRRSMNVPPPLPPNPPPLPLIPPTHSFWGPKSKKGKNRASNRQSNSSISSSSKESILNPDSEKKDDARPRTWKLLDDPEKIEVLQDEKEHAALEESTKDQKPKKGKKSRPVSFADNVATVMGPTSDTESADHGSADKSSVSKLTNEKQSKKPKLMSNLIDSFKKKNRDKVADNEGSRGTTLESNKDPEQLPLDGTKTEGIVYAELDIARGQGNVMRRDDDKTEYAEIIHPKQADHKKSKEELRKSRENLSGSREHLTEPEGEPKKEATV